eukprot:836593-Amphidinium_carterae.2
MAKVPTVVVGGGHGVIPAARKSMAGSVQVAKRDEETKQVEEKVGLFVLSTPDTPNQERAAKLLAAPWRMLGLLVITALAHSLHQMGVLQDHRLQRCGPDWMWLMSDTALLLPTHATETSEVGELVQAAVLAMEEQRQQLGAQCAALIQEGPVPYTSSPAHQIFWQDANKDVDAWREVLDETEVQLAARSAVGHWEPPAECAWRQKIT